MIKVLQNWKIAICETSSNTYFLFHIFRIWDFPHTEIQRELAFTHSRLMFPGQFLSPFFSWGWKIQLVRNGLVIHFQPEKDFLDYLWYRKSFLKAYTTFVLPVSSRHKTPVQYCSKLLKRYLFFRKKKNTTGRRPK